MNIIADFTSHNEFAEKVQISHNNKKKDREGNLHLRTFGSAVRSRFDK